MAAQAGDRITDPGTVYRWMKGTSGYAWYRVMMDGNDIEDPEKNMPLCTTNGHTTVVAPMGHLHSGNSILVKGGRRRGKT